jgi:GNAT superfamily N-acetyltransferase
MRSPAINRCDEKPPTDSDRPHARAEQAVAPVGWQPEFPGKRGISGWRRFSFSKYRSRLCLLLQATFWVTMREPMATPVLSLEDGSIFEVRPITPDDKSLLASGFEQLSERSRYLRFLGAMPALSRRQLAYLSELDHRNHVAVGVLHDGEPVAVGRWVRFEQEPSDADVAITVVDDHQGRGVGRIVIEVLAMIARHRDVRWLHFDVLAENTAMLRMLDRLGAVRTPSGPVIHAVLDADTVSAPVGVVGDLLGLVDDAARRAS